VVLGDKMRYYYLTWYTEGIRLKPYYVKIKNTLQDTFYLILSYIYIFTGINFKVGGSKK
jgi:hypothetical protein